MRSPAVGFESHLPERRRRASTTLYGGTCCSCSCCCLHAVGSLLGAALASASRSENRPSITIPHETDDHSPPTPITGIMKIDAGIQASRPAPIPLENDEDRPSINRSVRSGLSGPSLFWIFVFVLSVVTFIWASASGRVALPGALFILVITMPGIQLVAAVIVGIILSFSRRIDRDHQFSQLGRIVMGTIIGALAGILVMYLLARSIAILG